MFPGSSSFFQDPFFRDPALDVFGGEWPDPFSRGRRQRGARRLLAPPDEPSALSASHTGQSQALAPSDRHGIGRLLSHDIFSHFDSMVDQMEKLQSDPNAHVFSQSSFTAYSSRGDNGKPLCYQAMSSTHQAPGQIKETRQALRSSKTGIKKMSVGHHLGDRSHVIGHSFNHHTKQRHNWQNFDNMEESEASEFNEEWERKTQLFNREYNAGGKLQGRQRCDTSTHSKLADSTFRPHDHTTTDSTYWPRDRTRSGGLLTLTDGSLRDRTHVKLQHPTEAQSTKAHHHPKTPAQKEGLHLSGRAAHALQQERRGEMDRISTKQHLSYSKSERKDY